MQVKDDINLFTVLPIVITLVVQTSAGIWWAATVSAEISSIRDWQLRQDERLASVEAGQMIVNRQSATIQALLEVIREEVKESGDTVLDHIKYHNARQHDGVAR